MVLFYELWDDSGIKSIFVDRLTNEDLFFTKINRKIEKIILRNLKKKGVYDEGRYYGN